MKVIDDLLLIEVPIKCDDFNLYSDADNRKMLTFGIKGKKSCYDYTYTPKGKFKILGTITKDETTIIGWCLLDALEAIKKHGLNLTDNTKFLALKKVND